MFANRRLLTTKPLRLTRAEFCRRGIYTEPLGGVSMWCTIEAGSVVTIATPQLTSDPASWS